MRMVENIKRFGGIALFLSVLSLAYSNLAMAAPTSCTCSSPNGGPVSCPYNGGTYSLESAPSTSRQKGKAIAKVMKHILQENQCFQDAISNTPGGEGGCTICPIKTDVKEASDENPGGATFNGNTVTIPAGTVTVNYKDPISKN